MNTPLGQVAVRGRQHYWVEYGPTWLQVCYQRSGRVAAPVCTARHAQGRIDHQTVRWQGHWAVPGFGAVSYRMALLAAVQATLADRYAPEEADPPQRGGAASLVGARCPHPQPGKPHPSCSI